MRVLLINPLHDIPTVTSTVAVFELLEYADTKPDIDIDYLPGIMANRIMYNLYTTFKKYDLVVYYGHGEKDRLMGNHLYWSIINKKNIHKVYSAPFDTMACHSGVELGTFAIEQGVKAYIGTTDLYYAAFPEKERNFLRDWVDYTTIKTKALLDGATFEEAYNLFRERAISYLTLYKKSLGYKNYDWYAKTIEHNINKTILLGDKNARLV